MDCAALSADLLGGGFPHHARAEGRVAKAVNQRLDDAVARQILLPPERMKNGAAASAFGAVRDRRGR
jgi:hypothetical protein